MKQLVEFILILGIVLNGIVLINLFRIKQKVLPQKILIIFWLYILAIIVHFYSELLELRFVALFTYFFENGSRFFLAPLVYIYVKSIFLDRQHFIKRNLKHFIPFIIYFLLFLIPQMVNALNEAYIFTYPKSVNQTINWALIKDSYSIFYFSLALKSFYQAKKTMKAHYSAITEREFSWLQKFLISFLVVVCIDLLTTVNEIYHGYDVEWDAFITLAFLVFSIAYLGYYGLTQSTIFIPDFTIVNKGPTTNSISIKDNEEANTLKEFIENDKTYLIPNLTLQMLSKKVHITERKLSFLLNNVVGLPFYDFVNKYRIEEAKQRLTSINHDKYSITGIGLSCGFNSKSSFYRIFKKEVGLSPFKYKENRKE